VVRERGKASGAAVADEPKMPIVSARSLACGAAVRLASHAGAKTGGVVKAPGGVIYTIAARTAACWAAASRAAVCARRAASCRAAGAPPTCITAAWRGNGHPSDWVVRRPPLIEVREVDQMRGGVTAVGGREWRPDEPARSRGRKGGWSTVPHRPPSPHCEEASTLLKASSRGAVTSGGAASDARDVASNCVGAEKR